MHQSSPHNHQHDHTIVLQSRDVRTRKPLVIGSKQEHIYPARGSPPKPRPQVISVLSQAPPSKQQRVYSQEIFQDPEGGSLLVRFGIDSILGRMVARVLIAFMLFQPVYVALGMELEETPLEEVASVQTEETTSVDVTGAEQNTIEDDLVQEHVQAVDDSVEEFEAENETQEEFVTTEENAEENTDTSEAGEEETVADDETDSSYTESDEGASDNTDTSETEETEASSGEVHGLGDDTASTTEDVASTTEEVVVPKEVTLPINQNPDTGHVFSEGDCTLVSEGEFYCVAQGIERQATGDSRVYAEKDREGDREIYYFDGVEVQRITNNSYDDFAPVYDEETKRIVWQAMISDRLQIMVHEILTKTTRQITTGRQNSSNPGIMGDIVVWQEWVDTNWEIMMTDVNNDGQAFVIERLTDNVVHDMFPAVYDDLITWQSERGSSWEVVVYDIRTQKRHTLEKSAENTKYENPRFALLFDSKHENGDVETIGYDLGTGEMTELGTKANPKPFVPLTPKEEVPDALAQTASSTSITTKEDVDSGDDPIVE